MQKNRNKIAFLAFAMYFLTGAACVVVGSSLPQLIVKYEKPTETVVLLSTAFAIGRLVTVYFLSYLVERFGVLKIYAAGTVMLSAFLFGIPTFENFVIGLACAFLGGIGFAAQDTCCPLLVSIAYPKAYGSGLSAGQAFFGAGTFVTPFLVGILLAVGLPYYISYYMLLVAPVIMLILVCTTRIEKQSAEEMSEEEKVEPLYTRHLPLAYIAIVIEVIFYSATTNTLLTYTSSFAENLGISDSNAAFMLTVYNLGCIVGSLAFIWILRKVKSQTVLLFNNVAAGVVMVAMLILNQIWAYFAGLFIVGFFLGVLFSVVVSICTRVDHEHISRGASVVAMSGGLSDSINPVITGALVAAVGVGISYTYTVAMIIVSIIAAIILMLVTSDKEFK